MLEGMIAGSGEQLRQLLSDPALSGVGAVAVDEPEEPPLASSQGRHLLAS